MHNHKFLFFSAGIGVLLLFLLLSVAMKGDRFYPIDFDTTVRIQDHTPRKLDYVLSAFSVFGAFEIVTATLIVSLLLLHFHWSGLVVLMAYSVGLFVEVLGKVFIVHPGPPYMFFRNTARVLFPSSYVHTNYSYPSGHMLRTTFLVVFMMYALERTVTISPRWRVMVRALLIGFWGIMAYSRISLGEHWLTDVAGGTLLGLGLGLLAVSLCILCKTGDHKDQQYPKKRHADRLV